MGKRYRPVWQKAFAVFLLLQFCSGRGYTQVGIGGGFEYGTAAVINNGLLIRRPSLGISGMLSYAPRDSKLFPSVTYLLKNIVVPVNNSSYPGLQGNANYQHFVLNLNYRVTQKSNYAQPFIGIGIAKIIPAKTLYDTHGNELVLTGIGSVNLYPMLQVGWKYMHRVLSNSSFYFGFEANLKYIRMHSDNVYYLQQGTNSVSAAIWGDIIFPGIQVHLDYIFDGKEE